jgi:toxin ParE1/3/4
MPVRLRSAAEEDVAGHARHLQERSVEAAIRFLDAVDAALELIALSPGIGGICRYEKEHLRDMRVLPISGFKSYLVFYRVLPNEIEVIRVLHGARDLASVFGN